MKAKNNHFKNFLEKGYGRAFKEWTIGFSMILFPLTLLSGNNWETALIIAPIASLLMAIIILPLGYWSFEILKPKSQNKKLNDPAIKQFIDLGFERKATWLQGKYKEYYGIILWTDNNPLNTPNKINYSVQIIFYFEGPQHFLKNVYNNYIIEEQIIWGADYVAAILESGKRKLQDSEQVKKKADRLVQLLLIFNLKPISEEVFKTKELKVKGIRLIQS